MGCCSPFPAPIAEGPPGCETTPAVVLLGILAGFPISHCSTARGFTRVPAEPGGEGIEVDTGNRVSKGGMKKCVKVSEKEGLVVYFHDICVGCG